MDDDLVQIERLQLTVNKTIRLLVLRTRLLLLPLPLLVLLLSLLLLLLLMFPGISLTSFSEPLLITSNAPTTTGIISLFICHILVISISRSLYLERFLEIIIIIILYIYLFFLQDALGSARCRSNYSELKQRRF